MVPENKNRKSSRRDSRSGSGGSRGRGRSRGTVRADGPGPETVAKFLDILKQPLSKSEYIVFDIETTGGNPEKNGITEISALKVAAGEVIDTFSTLVNPCIPIPPIVRRMTGITNQMVRGAPRIEEVMPGFLEFVGPRVLVSHNTIGDMKFIRYFGQAASGVAVDNFYLCTHLLVEKLIPESPDKSLKGLAEFLNLSRGVLHRAEADANLTLLLFKELKRRLAERSVNRVEEAIRLQGDLESAMRLGWGLTEKSWSRLPQGPGVFYLRDHQGKMLFLSSAANVQREFSKFRVFHQLPRQLLRLALRTYDLDFREHPHHFDAFLAECDEMIAHKIPFDPSAWHQRQVQSLNVYRESDGIRLQVGSIDKDTVWAFGPVRDRKVAADFLVRIANALGNKVVRNGLTIPAEYETALIAWMRGTLAAELETLRRSLRSVKMWFRPAERKRIRAHARMADSLIAVTGMNHLQDLLHRTGVILLPGPRPGAYVAHLIACTRPVGQMTLDEDTAQKVRAGNFPARITDRLAEESKKLADQPVTEADAPRINAVLWWILYGRGETRFIPVP